MLVKATKSFLFTEYVPLDGKHCNRYPHHAHPPPPKKENTHSHTHTHTHMVTRASIYVSVNIFHFQQIASNTVYSYFMPVCSIVKTITPRCRGLSLWFSAIVYQVVHGTSGK